jgi:hypothetical protein
MALDTSRDFGRNQFLYHCFQHESNELCLILLIYRLRFILNNPKFCKKVILNVEVSNVRR